MLVKASASKILQSFFSEGIIPNDLATVVTGDEPLTMALAKGGNISDAEFSFRMVESSSYDSSDRVSLLRADRDGNLHCITESAN